MVCAKGTEFSTSTTYDIAYYDGAGAKVIEESAVTASGGTLQSASYTISSCCATSTAGTWHVVAFELAATPPTNYSAIVQNIYLVVADDIFTVNAPAIPELPTVLAAIGIGAAAYLWSSPAFGELRMNVTHPLALVSQEFGLLLFAIAMKRRGPLRPSVVPPALLTGLLSIAALVTFGVDPLYLSARAGLSGGWIWLGYVLWSSPNEQPVGRDEQA